MSPLKRPSSCLGCPLNEIAHGFMKPNLSQDPHRYGVTLLGEDLKEDDLDAGLPFQGSAGFRLTRLLEWAGLDRSKFDLLNSTWCHLPNHKLEGSPFESSAITHCRLNHWGHLLKRSTVVVPLGNVPTAATVGRKGILQTRGYIYPGTGPFDGLHLLPTVHPLFIQRGNAKWSAAFIHDLQKAVRLAQEGFPPQLLDYVLDPSPARALDWAQGYLQCLAQDPNLKLAFDIETPGKDEEEDELEIGEGLPDATWNIFRIGFSYRGLSALSIPWEPPFYPAIRLLLGSSGPKVVWNAGFDVPRVKRAGFPANGLIHDGMVAWHILHSDLPKRLGFVATFTCPFQGAWKHLSGSKPAFYNATDADVEWRSMDVIESELRRTGLWEVYKRDVLQLDPILTYMSEQGMRIDSGVREDRARRLSLRLSSVRSELESLVPIEARRIEHVYVNPPKDVSGLLSRKGTRTVSMCPVCGTIKPPKAHFTVFKKKVNPCGGKLAMSCQIEVDEYYRLAEFKLSRNLLISYHNHLKRPLPLVWDRKAGKRKVSFDEEQMKKLILKYPTDRLYPLVLDYRGLDKLAGTYIGRFTE